MTIQPLPQAAIRAIGSSQVLVDPSAVVKEFLDNALDAGATSISVEISSNTLDVMQVKDNGHGIAPADRVMVAKRYCTSKISSEADLLRVGGSSLGFRGEALASVAELSGSLDMTTRVEGESTATILRINGQGEVVSSAKAASPMGTTVRLADFLKCHPVRRRVALKNTEACLQKIKLTLQRYAFTHPCVRLSFRVLRAKSERANITYAPGPDGDIRDTAIKIVGANCAIQCASTVVEHAGFRLCALLPSPEAIPSSVSTHGSFISIDARPMSSCRGIARSITKAFRKKLTGLQNKLSEASEPFLYLDIRCPTSSYDVNIEPAKDDVLFEDSGIILEAVKRLFSAAYPDEPSTAPKVPQIIEDETFPVAVDATREDYGSLQPTDSTSVMHDIGHSRIVPPLRHPQTTSPVEYGKNMYDADEDDSDMGPSTLSASTEAPRFAEEQVLDNDSFGVNPWTIAKANAPIRSLLSQFSPRDQGQRSHQTDLSSSPFPSPTKKAQQSFLPTPRPSSPMTHELPFDPSHYVPQIRLSKDGRVIVDPQHEAASGSVRRVQSAVLAGVREDPITPNERGLSLAYIPHVTSRLRQQKRSMARPSANKTFPSLTKDSLPREKVWFDHLENIEQRGSPVKRRRLHALEDSSQLVKQGELGDLGNDSEPSALVPHNRDIRDFVRPGLTATTPPSSIEVTDIVTDVENRPPGSAPCEVPSINQRTPTASDQNQHDTPSDLFILEQNPHAPPTHTPQESEQRQLCERRAFAELHNSAIRTPVTKTLPLSDTLSTQCPRSARHTRTTPGNLLLETTPFAERTHNLMYIHDTTSPISPTPLAISRRFHDPPNLAPTPFFPLADDALNAIVNRLYALLQRNANIINEHDIDDPLTVTPSPTTSLLDLTQQLRAALQNHHAADAANHIS
ncbi:hypothetical protein MRB53_037738 [Persea americana]|nr:hypothetical protein MRB53_037738 [Persea americana]